MVIILSCIYWNNTNLDLLWRYSRPVWTRSYAACYRWPCFGREVGLDDPQRSLPTPTILWFCDQRYSSVDVVLGDDMAHVLYPVWPGLWSGFRESPDTRQGSPVASEPWIYFCLPPCYAPWEAKHRVQFNTPKRINKRWAFIMILGTFLAFF